MKNKQTSAIIGLLEQTNNGYQIRSFLVNYNGSPHYLSNVLGNISRNTIDFVLLPAEEVGIVELYTVFDEVPGCVQGIMNGYTSVTIRKGSPETEFSGIYARIDENATPAILAEISLSNAEIASMTQPDIDSNIEGFICNQLINKIDNDSASFIYLVSKNRADNDYWRQYSKNKANIGFHFSGTIPCFQDTLELFINK